MERRFRDRFLTSPARYFRDCQWEQAERLLRSGKDVLTTATTAGFASPGRLHDVVVARRGMTPGEVRQGGAGVHIDFGYFDTPLGIVLLAATARGLCALRLCQFSGSQHELDELRRDFPQAQIVENPGAAQPYADQLVAFLDAHADTFAPRVDILRGTTFQREVWAELQNLKPGETVSYRELARRLGRPKAVRAVAGACGANHLAIAIPCHRAIRSDGSLAGFRWGKAWKRRLLDLEAQIPRREAGSAH
jgi:AraC family transcriptional regulator of adaptative response/methylated-DNA-[protein]-cysteine methyltransferase